MAKRKKIEFNSDGVEALMEDTLNSIEEDIEEATQNIALYKTEIVNNPLGKESFGHLMNEALKIKGLTRDRMLKIVNIVKDRVKMKEILSSTKGGVDMAPEDMVAMVDKYMRSEDGEEEDDDNATS